MKAHAGRSATGLVWVAETKSAFSVFHREASGRKGRHYLLVLRRLRQKHNCRSLQPEVDEKMIYGGKDGGKECRSVQPNLELSR